MNELIEKAKSWAHAAHDSIGQMRKYGGEVYWVHTDAVAGLLENAGESLEVVAAGHLHDVLEDVAPKNPDYSEANMRKEFGDVVTDLVVEVTNVYTKENYPDLNRARRKHLEHKRIGGISRKGKTVKNADVIHNVTGIFEVDKGFGRKFVSENAELLPFLRDSNETLYDSAVKAVTNELNKFNNL